VIIGREDPVSGHFPDIDLTDHGGDEGGVSRKHARIYTESGQFYIEDLKSVNFTYVNRQKLPPRQPQPLNNGDEIRLGNVKLTFQRM
jgi:pSer/pThr/pTyr-binding forkhead associated (FHA) protein